MLWDTALISKLLELYKDNRVLWDQKHPEYGDAPSRHIALQGIHAELGLPVSPNDIHRKYKTMRAAYQVEMRNLNAAKIRGFFYKPSLHWFDVFHRFRLETSDIKAQDEIKQPVLTNEKFHKMLSRPINEQVRTRRRIERMPDIKKKKKLRVEVASDEASSESEDEFQSFADHIAVQLRGMSVHRAVMIQNQIQRLFASDREMNDISENEGYGNEFMS